CAENSTPRAPATISWTTRMVVSTDTISTTNITGLRASVRGSSLMKACLTAVTIRALDIAGLVFCRPTRNSGGVVVMLELMELPSIGRAGEHLEVLDDGPQRQRWEINQPTRDHDHRDQEPHVNAVIGGKSARGRRDDFLRRQRSRDRQHR